LHCPVISAINGSAIGAGLCLALACDLKIAAKDAKLGVTFAALGFHPGMGASHYLPKLVGNQLATKMLLLGDLITGILWEFKIKLIPFLRRRSETPWLGTWFRRSGKGATDGAYLSP
jgi:hypothetical protein